MVSGPWGRHLLCTDVALRIACLLEFREIPTHSEWH